MTDSHSVIPHRVEPVGVCLWDLTPLFAHERKDACRRDHKRQAPGQPAKEAGISIGEMIHYR